MEMTGWVSFQEEFDYFWAKKGEMGAVEFRLFRARRGDSVVGNGGSVGFYYTGGPRAGGSIPCRTAMAFKRPVR